MTAELVTNMSRGFIVSGIFYWPESDPEYQRIVTHLDAAIGRGVAGLLLSSIVSFPLALILIGVAAFSRGGPIGAAIAALLIYGGTGCAVATRIVVRRTDGSAAGLLWDFDRQSMFSKAIFTEGVRISIRRLTRGRRE
ncbi:MAG: hypothetical protein ACRDRT_13515 [Pseudonocardiaceae bacterium]